jgi:tRNA 2-thiouridine synthesizing protein A
MDVIAPTTTATTVDARGQSCPGPLVTLARAIRDAHSGELFELLATDPGSRSDVPSWATLTGNALVGTDEADGVFRYVIRKA